MCDVNYHADVSRRASCGRGDVGCPGGVGGIACCGARLGSEGWKGGDNEFVEFQLYGGQCHLLVPTNRARTATKTFMVVLLLSFLLRWLVETCYRLRSAEGSGLFFWGGRGKAAAVLIRVLRSGLFSRFWVGWPRAVTSPPLLYPWILHAAEAEQRWSKTQKWRRRRRRPVRCGGGGGRSVAAAAAAAAEGESSSRIFGWGSATQEKNDLRPCDFRRCINPFEMLLELALLHVLKQVPF